MKTEAPIEVFNNIILGFTKQLGEILDEKNQEEISKSLYFIENSINIYGWIKLYQNANGEICLKILKPIDKIDLLILEKIQKNWHQICRIYWYYLMMYNKIALNSDDVPQQLINQIVWEITTLNKSDSKEYLLPFKNKLSKLDLDINFYDKFEYFFCFSKDIENSKQFSFKIKKVVINNKDKNIVENLRYEEIDILHKGSYFKQDALNFVTELFLYGNILYK